MAKDRRRSSRCEIETLVLYKVEARPGAPPPREKTGRSGNVGEVGLLLETEEYLPPGTRLILLLVRGKRGVVEGQGEVVWSEGPASKPLIHHGVRITRMEPPQQLAWDLFLDEAGREMGRRPIRFDVDLPAICRPKEGHDPVEGRVVNVSRTGMLVLLPVRFPEQTVLTLDIQALGRRHRAETRVVRVEGRRPDGVVPHGLAYVDPHAGSRLLPELLLVGLL